MDLLVWILYHVGLWNNFMILHLAEDEDPQRVGN